MSKHYDVLFTHVWMRSASWSHLCPDSPFSFIFAWPCTPIIASRAPPVTVEHGATRVETNL
jgi:hypothetical protein